jgi:hypothetical protein
MTDTTDLVMHYPAEPDTRHASAETVTFFDSFFAAKNSHVVADTMAHFSPEVVTYTESILGWPLDGFEVIEQTFAQHMPTWPATALSYPTRILGGTGSVLVAFTDMPELFGAELRLLGAVDFKDGKIVRWVDYWDSSAFDGDLYAQLRTPAESFPTDLKDGAVPTRAAADLVETATRLQRAFASTDASAAGALLHTDVVMEDMALRVRVIGRLETVTYLGRVLGRAPYGESSALRHVVGGSRGGGFEWTAGAETGGLVGITALERDTDGLITRITSVYDSRQLGPDRKLALQRESFGS